MGRRSRRRPATVTRLGDLPQFVRRNEEDGDCRRGGCEHHDDGAGWGSDVFDRKAFRKPKIHERREIEGGLSADGNAGEGRWQEKTRGQYQEEEPGKREAAELVGDEVEQKAVLRREQSRTAHHGLVNAGLRADLARELALYREGILEGARLFIDDHAIALKEGPQSQKHVVEQCVGGHGPRQRPAYGIEGPGGAESRAEL